MLAQARTKLRPFVSVVSRFNSFGGLKLSGRQNFVHKQQQYHMGSVQGKPNREPLVLASHILTKDEEAANLAVERVNKGEDFEVVARELSECPSKSQGGSLGWFGKGKLALEVEAAAFDEANTPGSLTMVHTSLGWHVLRVNERKTPPPAGDMSVQELASILKSKSQDIQLVDVREENELKIASLPPTIPVLHLPLSVYRQQASSACEKLDPRKDTVIFCHHGRRSQTFLNALCSQGCYPGMVYNLVGGIHEYSSEVDSTVPKY